jgi:glycosyltransferase involved in cell wall biosynthesis
VITAGHVTDAEAPAISVIIATRDRPRALARCLDALEKQQRAKDGFEIIVVDDAPEATAIIPDGLAFAVRVLRSRGAGAAAARNLGAREARGRYVLFLDDDLVAASDLLLRHQDAHAAHGASAVVIGSCLPAPVEPTLAAQSAALWWTDHYRVKSDSAALMFVDVLSGNTSLARVLFEELGGFDEAFATHRREDWEFGIRALRAGAVAIHAPEAVARHEFNLTTRRMIAATRSEGTGDALIAARWPELASSLPPVTPPPPGLLRAASRSAVLESSLVQRVSPLLLDVLEWSRARSPWYRLFNRTLEAAYARSRREAAALHGNVVTLNIPPLTVDLDKTDPIEPPAVASPMIRVRWRGRVLGTIRPVDGQWSAADLASRMLHLAGPEVWTALGRPVAAPGRRANGKWLPPGFVHAPPRHDGAGWRALDDWLRMSEAPVVVILLLANPAFDVPPGGLDVFSSPRVGLAFGAHSMGAILGPARVFSGEVGSKPSDLRRLVPEYLAVRPEMLRSIGGIDAGVVRWGGQAVVQDLTERALAAGYHVAWQDFPGSIPPHPGKVDTWRRHYWAGSVAVRRVAEAGLSGVPEFLRSVPRSRRPRSLAFHGAAFGSGVLGGLCEFLPEHFATARTAGRTMASDQPSVPSGKRRRGERGWEPGA